MGNRIEDQGVQGVQGVLTTHMRTIRQYNQSVQISHEKDAAHPRHPATVAVEEARYGTTSGMFFSSSFFNGSLLSIHPSIHAPLMCHRATQCYDD